MGAGLRHPFGLTLLIASLLLSGVMRFLPALERWSAEALWVLLAGFLAYVASVLALYQTRSLSSAESPESTAVTTESVGDVGGDGRPSVDFLHLVDEALRQLNNPATLSRCGLIPRLPGTLAATRSQRGSNMAASPGLLEQGQSLRTALLSALDRLKPSDEAVRARAPEALQYQIIHEEYVLERSTTSIIVRHSISESTFYRNRRLAVSALAHDLESQEDRIARGPGPR